MSCCNVVCYFCAGPWNINVYADEVNLGPGPGCLVPFLFCWNIINEQLIKATLPMALLPRYSLVNRFLPVMFLSKFVFIVLDSCIYLIFLLYSDRISCNCKGILFNRCVPYGVLT